MRRRVLLNDAGWVAALAHPDNRIVFSLHGYDVVEPDWGFRDRVLGDHLMFFVTGGGVVGDIEGVPFSLRAGSHLWMQPGPRHTFALASDLAPLAVYFVRFRLRRPGGDEVALAGRTHHLWDGAWDLQELTDQVVDELGAQLTHRDVRVRSLLVTLCTAALRHAERSAVPAAPGTLSRPQRQAIEAHVRENLAARPAPADLAALVHLSHDYFSRLFAQTYGVAPRAWLVQVRMRWAARSLSESLQNVSEVAASLGYDDVSAFSHQFKQCYGVSPRAYRRQQT